MRNVVINRHALTDLREARKLTKQELAKRAGISASYMTMLENGDKPGTPKVVEKLAEALAVNELSLLAGPNGS